MTCAILKLFHSLKYIYQQQKLGRFKRTKKGRKREINHELYLVTLFSFHKWNMNSWYLIQMTLYSVPERIGIEGSEKVDHKVDVLARKGLSTPW